ncbi:hypothetical protein CWI42_121040 [Ordospora colligata]|uniref:Uncharacterized protein n=1 Tax=Ordospora colligata OC4 TaxID=1354746 RepID=A0A0B2UIK9_9MICR|nr:uncharacterized protein M896_121040 [Ordospora colligata OC4]KHN68882.1 hypothetical protein M896_121040 [Ordospora colligata OC4]TBU13916.1 hypothetical protein CWI40_121040 [Ordospora colligata]TBU14105.1 hypothetical protein CWI41_121040 [Ordospora colligata]TBU17774.1 hypothetical protein CWI42_121040 [Ordospora colligata]
MNAVDLMASRIQKSIRYRDYETGIFASACMLKHGDEFKILIGMLLYMNGEYSRALFHLQCMNTYTSKYYECLCYKKQKEYKKAIGCIEEIFEKKVVDDPEASEWIREMFIDAEDAEYLHSLLGDLYTFCGNREEAIEKYQMSLSKGYVFSSFENLLEENKAHLCVMKMNGKSTDLEDIIEEYLHDSIDRRDGVLNKHMKKYLDKVPGVGSYFISNAARMYFNLGMNEKSKMCFELVRRKDPMFVKNMDYYSTILWHSKDAVELGSLCKGLIKHMPGSANTWKALGNFYSHEGDYQRSVVCFKRSLCIEEDAYAYTLLGYESIQRNEYDNAMKYFNMSLRMHEGNYRAMFGSGLVYMKTEKLDNAEYFLRKAVETNPGNLQIKVHVMKFYTKRGRVDESMNVFADAFGMSDTDVHEIVRWVVGKKGRFREVEEFLVLELVEVLVLKSQAKLAMDVLECVEYRGESYSKKKEMVMDIIE